MHISKFYPPYFGGIEKVAYDLSTKLNMRGIECDVLCNNTQNKTIVETFENVKVTRAASLFRLRATSISPQYLKILKSEISQYSLIHCQVPNPTATLALLFVRKCPPLIIHWQSDIVRQKILRIFFKPLQTLLLKKASIIVVATKDYMEGSKDLKPFLSKCRIIPNGLEDIEKDCATPKFATKNRMTVFTLGRHVSYKGFQYLVEAAQFFDDNIDLVIGGDGPLSAALRQQVQDSGLSAKVRFVGKIPNSDLLDYYESADIFCLPSITRAEAFGVVLLEAMRASLPLVTVDVKYSGMQFVNNPPKTGLKVAPKSPKSLSDAINLICRDEALRKSMGESSRQRFIEHFLLDNVVDAFVQLYKEVTKIER